MSLDTWLLYLVAVLILTASPGPSSLLCLTRGALYGWRIGVYTALGSLSAITMILTLSITGLGVLITSSELAFNLIKWCGAAYLIYLGYQSLTSTQRDYTAGESQYSDGGSRGFVKHYVAGFIVGASNPKAILFFTALFPQFINPDAPLISQYAIFAATFMVLELSWLAGYAYAGAKSSGWLFVSGRARLFNRLTGSVFIGAGTLLSMSSRA